MTESVTPTNSALNGLLRRRELWLPTWRGWLILLAGLSVIAATLAWAVFPFLGPQAPLGFGLAALVLCTGPWVTSMSVPAAGEERDR